MASKTTVAIDEMLRKKIKKLSVIMDISQGAVINKAIQDLEKKILSNNNKPNTEEDSKIQSIDSILKRATQEVYASDPEFKEMQENLFSGPDSIDDYIIKNWNSGLDEE